MTMITPSYLGETIEYSSLHACRSTLEDPTEAFPDAHARHTHDHGPGGQNFLRSELLHDVLAYPAQLYRLDVLHGKFGVMLGQPVKPA